MYSFIFKLWIFWDTI